MDFFSSDLSPEIMALIFIFLIVVFGVYKIITKKYEERPESKYHIRKLIKYITMSTLVIYMVCGVANTANRTIKYNNIIDDKDYLEEQLKEMQEIADGEKEEADGQLNMVNGGIKNRDIQLRSKYPNQIFTLTYPMRIINIMEGDITFAVVTGIIVGIIIYMYKYFDKLSKFIIGIVILITILVILCMVDISCSFVRDNTDLMGVGCNITIMNFGILNILMPTILISTIVKVASNYINKKRLNDLIKVNSNSKGD